MQLCGLCCIGRVMHFKVQSAELRGRINCSHVERLAGSINNH